MTEAAICVVHDADGRVLAVSRDGNPHDMSIPGGHVEPGETPEQAAIREVLEETGLTVSNLEKLFEHREPGEDSKLVHVFRAHASNAHTTNVTPEPGEYTRFVPTSELRAAKSFGGFVSRYANKLFGAQAASIRVPQRLPEHVTADLGPSSVHVDGLGGGYRRETERERNPAIPDLSGLGSPAFAQPVPPRREDVQPFPRWPLADQVNMISAAKRKSLPDSKFALPEKSAYPIDTAARVRNAAARLEQNKSRLTPGEYSKAKSRIASAAKKFGIHSEYNNEPARATDAVTPHMHVQAVIPHGGHLHVRHLSEDRAQVLALDDEGGEYFGITTLLDDVGASEGAVWNQVACVGAFRGHPAGPFELNEHVFEEIVRNWEAGGRKPIPVDFEHASEADATAGTIPQKGAPAQAWIVDLRYDPKGLYGLFDDWDPTARSYVKTKRYRFFSPAIRFGARDKVTGRPIGARLTSGALTNQPFLDNLPALKARTPTGDLIAARDVGGEQLVTMQTVAENMHSGHFITPASEYMPKLKACMGLHPLATCEDMKDHLDKLRDHLAKANGNVNANVRGVSLAAFIHPMRSLTYGDSAHAVTAEQILDAVERMVDAADDSDAADMNDLHSMATAIESDKVPMATAIESDKQPAMRADDTDQGDADMATMKELETENTTLKITLADKETEIKTLGTKVTELEKWRKQREEADLAADVEFALSEHTDRVAALGDDDDARRKVLLKFRTESPEVFATSFPRSNAAGANSYLLSTVTPPPPAVDMRTAASPTGVPELDPIFANSESVDDTAERLCSEQKISFLEASEQALKLHDLARAITQTA